MNQPVVNIALPEIPPGYELEAVGSLVAIRPAKSGHSVHRVREFHERFGHPVAERPTPATRELRELRVKLIAEELAELCCALGVNLFLDVNLAKGNMHEMAVTAYRNDDGVDLVEAADALGDIDYVVQGANLVFGLPAVAVAEEIHRSNMSKLGADGKPIYREDGKIMKGPNYTRPDIARLIAEAHGVQPGGGDGSNG